jgi:outer membrane protein assembly factor BamA
LAAGTDAIRRLYVARGYLASTAAPQMQFDDAAHSVVLNIAVDEDSQFRFRNLSLSGLTKSTEEVLQQQWQKMKEQPYSSERLRTFFARFFRPVQPHLDPMEYSTSNIDLNTHTVDIQLSFVPMTQAEKAAQ